MRTHYEKITGLKLKDAADYEVGKTYYNGYWNETYKVLDIVPSELWDKEYKCLWQDGRITTHSTAFDPKLDFEVI